MAASAISLANHADHPHQNTPLCLLYTTVPFLSRNHHPHRTASTIAALFLRLLSEKCYKTTIEILPMVYSMCHTKVRTKTPPPPEKYLHRHCPANIDTITNNGLL